MDCQDEYSILNSKHFIGIHGYMLVYSVSSLPSFEMVQVVREKILNHLVSSQHRWCTYDPDRVRLMPGSGTIGHGIRPHSHCWQQK